MLRIYDTIEQLRRAAHLSPRKSLAIIDIDGVMEDNRHRLGLICEERDGIQVKRKNADWAAYEALAHLDTPGMGVPVAIALAASHVLVYLTARIGHDDAASIRLADRMARYTGKNAPVIMRPPLAVTGRSQHPSATDFKEEVLDRLLLSGLQVAIAVDDSLKNCEMFSRRGIVSLRLHNHIDASMLGY